MTRGIRNNNPLNIRHSADHWQGARIEQTDPSFVQFQSMAYGYRAAWKVLESYWKHFKRHRQPFTVQSIIHRWAPPSENNTESYINNVCQNSGLNADETISINDQDKLTRMVYAMSISENGYRDKAGNNIAQRYDLPNMNIINEGWRLI